MGCNISTIYTGIDYISLADDCQESGFYNNNDVINCKFGAMYNNIGALYYLRTYYYNNSIINEHNTMIKFAIYSARYNYLTK